MNLIKELLILKARSIFKKTPIVKSIYTISEDDKNKILEYIDKVDKTNADFKRTEKLSVTLNNVDIELNENREKIKILTENNETLSLKVDTLSNIKYLAKTKNVKIIGNFQKIYMNMEYLAIKQLLT